MRQTWHDVPMGWREFSASVIGDVLSWPVITLIAILLLLKPIRELVGRIKTAKGFGGELNFGDLIGGAEKSIDKAIEDSGGITDSVSRSPDTDSPSSTSESDEQSAGVGGVSGAKAQRSPVADPSGAILTSWESLVSTLADLSRVNAGRGRPAQAPSAIIRQIRGAGFFSTSFYDAFENLREARNRVAHGEVIPTVGAAMAFVESAEQLESMVRGQIAVAGMDLDKPIIDG